MVIYIHGFGSSGEGSKAKVFREYFKSLGEPFIAPSLSYVPRLAIKTLEELIESYGENVSLIGSSLGGFYAIYLARKYGLKAVLINPSVYPYITLSRVVGSAQNYYDGSSFEWRDSHIEMLKSYDTKVEDQDRFLLLVQKGDEVLDYKEAVEKLPDADLVIEEGGNHSFDGIERYLEKIKNFLSQEGSEEELFSMQSYQKHLAIALTAHKEQLTPHGLPYAFHVVSTAAEVMDAIAAEKLSKEKADIAIGCALLHDVLEDTMYDLESEELDHRILSGVKALTKNKSLPGKLEQMQDSLKRLKNEPLHVQMVKFADRLTNLGTPPPHWSREKIMAYKEEALLIKKELRSPHGYLEKRLQHKIDEYSKYID